MEQAAMQRTVASLVPEGFAAYARVLHPAARDDTEVRWAVVARVNGRRVHPGMQWSAIAGTWCTAGATAWQEPEDLWEEPDGHDGRLWTRRPRLGSLPPAQARLLAVAVRTGVVATDTDQDSTYVGADRATVEALLCHPALEVVEVRHDQPIGRDSDTINRPRPLSRPRRGLFRRR